MKEGGRGRSVEKRVCVVRGDRGTKSRGGQGRYTRTNDRQIGFRVL